MPKIQIIEKTIRYELKDENGNVLYTGTETRLPEPSEVMDLEYKIHRKVTVGDKTFNIRAQTEQEYADKLAACAIKARKEEDEKREKETKHNFKQYAMMWYERSSKPTISKVSQTTYERQLQKYIYPALGVMYVEDIKPEDVQEMFNGMGDVAKATKDKVRMVLNQIFEVALEDELLRFNPLKSKKVSITGKTSKPREAYTVEQMRHIVKNIPEIKKPEDRAYIALAALHPMRPEEILGLQWRDIHFNTSTISIQRAVTHPDRNHPQVKETKTGGSTREIALSDIAKATLETMTQGSGFIFGGEEPYTFQKVRKLCERVQKNIGAEFAITPARFRPTVITDLFSQTKDAKLVQQLAGHASFDTTLKHYISARTDKSQGAAAIDSLYAQK